MSVVVYGRPVNPFVRSVLLTAKVIDLEVQLKVVDLLKKEHMSKEFLKINPAHCIPVMDDDGFILFESRAIMGYLVDKYAKDVTLYPKDLKKQFTVNSMLFFEASNFFPSLAEYYKPILFAGKPPDLEKEAILKEKLGIFDTILSRHPYVAGDHLTIADLSRISSLNPLDTLGFRLDDYTNITKWKAKLLKEIPFLEEDIKKAIEDFTVYCGEKRKIAAMVL